MSNVYSWWVKVRESLNTQVITWIKTILNHFNTSIILPRYEGICTVYIAKWYQTQNIMKYVYFSVIKKCDIPIMDT
jgi:hypothetical protein